MAQASSVRSSSPLRGLGMGTVLVSTAGRQIEHCTTVLRTSAGARCQQQRTHQNTISAVHCRGSKRQTWQTDKVQSEATRPIARKENRACKPKTLFFLGPG